MAQMSPLMIEDMTARNPSPTSLARIVSQPGIEAQPIVGQSPDHEDVHAFHVDLYQSSAEAPDGSPRANPGYQSPRSLRSSESSMILCLLGCDRDQRGAQPISDATRRSLLTSKRPMAEVPENRIPSCAHSAPLGRTYGSFSLMPRPRFSLVETINDARMSSYTDDALRFRQIHDVGQRNL